MLKCQSAIVMRTGFFLPEIKKIQLNQGDRNGGHLTGCGGLISVPVAQYVSVAVKEKIRERASVPVALETS